MAFFSTQRKGIEDELFRQIRRGRWAQEYYSVIVIFFLEYLLIIYYEMLNFLLVVHTIHYLCNTFPNTLVFLLPREIRLQNNITLEMSWA